MSFRHRTAAAAVVLLLASGALQAQIDITSQALPRISRGMTSMDIAIFGVRLGMAWDDARFILDRDRVPYLFTHSLPLRVYLPPENPSWYFGLNPSSYEVEEMGICGDEHVPRPNRLLADGQRWKLTTARAQFFGYEGDFIRNEEGEGVHYPDIGFALKCIDGSGFRFVMLKPTGWHPRPPSFPPLTVSIPFFVTGYWKPNTSANLAELRAAYASGGLRAAGIINTGDEDYEALALDVDRAVVGLARAIESRLMVLAPFFDDVSVVLTTVSGFSDPRLPRGGRYLGPMVRTSAFTIPDKARIDGAAGNLLLSRLRAVYTTRELEKALASSAVYQRFKSAGRIRWVPEGHGTRDGNRDNVRQRRAEIVMRVEYRRP